MKIINKYAAFIDTSEFQRKNFQFDKHALETLSRLINDGEITLYMPDIVINEIQAHLLDKSKESASIIKKATKDAMFLRNTPELGAYGIFDKISHEEIYKIVNEKFNNFLNQKNIIILETTEINPKPIFDQYFKSEPPFDGGCKKHEFPDAFSLSTVLAESIKTGRNIYLVSQDNGMKSYAQSKTENFTILNGVDELIGKILKDREDQKSLNESVSAAYKSSITQIIIDIEEKLDTWEFYAEDIDHFNCELTTINIKDVTALESKPIFIDKINAAIETKMSAVVQLEYCFADYNNSPYDGEEKEYVYIIRNNETREHKVEFTAESNFSINNETQLFEYESSEIQEDPIEVNREESRLVGKSKTHTRY